MIKDDAIILKILTNAYNQSWRNGIGLVQIQDEPFVFEIKDGHLLQVSEFSVSQTTDKDFSSRKANEYPDMAFAIVYSRKDNVKIRRCLHHTSKVQIPSENETVDQSLLKASLENLESESNVPHHLVAKALVHLERHMAALKPAEEKNEGTH